MEHGFIVNDKKHLKMARSHLGVLDMLEWVNRNGLRTGYRGDYLVRLRVRFLVYLAYLGKLAAAYMPPKFLNQPVLFDIINRQVALISYSKRVANYRIRLQW